MKFENIPTWQEWKSASSSAFQIRAHKPTLVRIDDLVKKYQQVFDTSKLNILMELKNAIADWAADKIDRDAGTGRLEAMQALLEVVIRKLYELDGWGKHQYLQAVCIGYRIVTGAYNENKVPAGPDPERTRQREETNEIAGRCTQLKAAIVVAHKWYQGYKGSKSIPDDEDRKTLKIFMAPEFFFRGPYGAYRDIGWNAKILSMMRTETSKVQYDDWLFVHGSALFSTDKMVNNRKVGVLLENYALAQKGGPKTSEHEDLIVAKEFPSHVDFKHPGLGNLQWFDPNTSQAKVGGQMQKNFMPEGGRSDPVNMWDGTGQPKGLDADTVSVSELVGGSIFTMDGITFGLEVCRDHLIGRLAHSHEAGKVLIQLVPSCGASIARQSIACVPDGIVFNVDGGAPKASTDLRVNTGVGISPPPAARANSGGGDIIIYGPERIPWPGLVRLDVAQRLKIGQSVLSGTAPPLPPRPNRI